MKSRKSFRRILALGLATVLLGASALSGLSSVLYPRAATPGDTVIAYGDGFHHYCIDGISNVALINGDEYTYVLPSQSLSRDETAVVFWSMFSLQASFGTMQDVTTAWNQMNQRAEEMGLRQAKPTVTETDLKKIIHASDVRAKYSWLDTVIANEETYLELAGLLGGGGATVGGRQIPSLLASHRSSANPLVIDKSTFTISFDAGGADADFIAKVPLRFSRTGADGSFAPQPPGSWTYEKSDTSIVFHNPDPEPPDMVIQFATEGTEYGSQGSYGSAAEVYENCLQIWVCRRCAGTHAQKYQGTAPLEAHQRLAFLEFQLVPSNYYAAIGGGRPDPERGTLEFQVYRHEEDFSSSYNVSLKKYDHETGKALEGAIFNLYERFDDRNVINRERDGAGEIYEGGEPYRSYHKDNPVVWQDFRFVSALVTDVNGQAEKTVNHGYHYDKTFCDGHPAPSFVDVPEPTQGESTEGGAQEGEGGSEEPENGELIALAHEENTRLANAWVDCLDACEAKASGQFSGVHFHWMMDEVDEDAIFHMADGGEGDSGSVSAGPTESADEGEAFRKSGCQDDVEETYQRFISLKYSYAVKEDTARAGYMQHGLHRDDLPIEVITTDASEHGAHETFAGEYSTALTVNKTMELRPAREVLAERAETETYGRLEKESHAELRLVQVFEAAWRKVNRLFSGEIMKEKRKDGNMLPTASPGNAEPEYRKATPAEAEPEYGTATPANAKKIPSLQFGRSQSYLGGQVDRDSQGLAWDLFWDDEDGETDGLFVTAYQRALGGESVGISVSPGPKDKVSHCFLIYDHRTEGEIHINKRDMDLLAGEELRPGYDSYGDTQGDGTLEGAVYGLFAAQDLVHPDGKTGVVYKANNLVATAVTDEDGNASFRAITVAPGHTYDYDRDQVVQTADGWATQAPKNLYVRDAVYDDYAEDGQYVRAYSDNGAAHGNCWISRPLFLGDYYIKELSRPEGYELSIGNRDALLTNRGQDPDVGIPDEREGYANLVKGLWAEEQISQQATGAYQDPDYNELFFTVESQGTGEAGFDLFFSNLPDGIRLYRLDKTMKDREAEVGTGEYEAFPVTDDQGNPVYVTAEHAYQYPKYEEDGSLQTRETAVTYPVKNIAPVEWRGLDAQKTEESLFAETGDMTAEEVTLYLQKGFDAKDQGDVPFVREKLETALRINGKHTPRADEGDGGTSGGSGEQGDFGYPILSVAVEKASGGEAVTVGDVLATLLDFYHTHGYYSCGGLHGVHEEANRWIFELYAGRLGNPRDFFVPGENGAEDGTFYHRVEWLPDDPTVSPRYLYASYGNQESGDTFGFFEDLRIRQMGGQPFVSAVLVTDAAADGDGNLYTKTVRENVYYGVGEIPRDAAGNPIQKVEYREKTTSIVQTVEEGVWTEIETPVTFSDGGQLVHVASRYRDAYGIWHSDVEPQICEYKIVLPERFVTLTDEDAAVLGAGTGWAAGAFMGAASHALLVRFGAAKSYLDYENRVIGGNNSYVKTVRLSYPGQYSVYQDGENQPGTNTRKTPQIVEDRIIREKIKVTKTVDHSLPDMEGDTGEEDAKPLTNFRFKVYLKSNLMRLYREESGTIVWQDRKGNPIDIWERKELYPQLAPKIYTESGDGEDSESGKTWRRLLDADGYDKFFDALSVANHDKWDDGAAEYTSHRPMGNTWNTIPETQQNAGYSDGVRQFAITWYLQKEILQQDGETVSAYEDERYDRALSEALKKAEDYLKPFFQYDLDEIYAIAWDSEEDGGKDGDSTTLSVDLLFSGEDGKEYAYGISRYLPYGVYVVAEQQPRYGNLQDFKNKHYQIDSPKEVTIPTLYEGGEAVSDSDWSILEPDDPSEDRYSDEAEQSGNNFQGFAYGAFLNRLFRARLRLEKLDSETHENILHDKAVFQIYRAQRDESEDGEGRVLFYEEDTLIAGTREFLEDMGARDITPVARIGGERYTGIVAKGTPRCREADRLPGDFSTAGSQNVGYTELPEALPAGVYVICERKTPAGYGKSHPMAVEIYSDQITYYQEGDPSRRVASTEYEYEMGKSGVSARIYVENRPLQVEVEKLKSGDDTVTFRVGTRLEGSYGEIGGRAEYEYAYARGEFLGYGWRKGTFEYLTQLREQGESVEIVYQDGIFAGYGYVTRKRETADDENPYVTGAVMTLFDALELSPSGDTQDRAYEGLVVKRNWTNQVTDMVVQDGNTDILYYDLQNLEVTFRQNIGGESRLYGFDRDHRKVDVGQLESDRVNHEKTDREFSLFAFRDGVPYLEFVGGDFGKLGYDGISKILLGEFALPRRNKNGNVTFGEGTWVYHLDRDGNRDSLVDPYTGMAYVIGESQGRDGNLHERILVWPVNAVRDDSGNVTARDKIGTSRSAVFGEDGAVYQNGTWKPETEGEMEESHQETTVNVNALGQALHGEARLALHNGSFEKAVNPVTDAYGLPRYYPDSGDLYEKGIWLYDRNGELVRWKNSDHLEAYDSAAFQIQGLDDLGGQAGDGPGEAAVRHRQGERYVLSNIWKTGDASPDHPFSDAETDGQPDLLSRVPAGCYILEELISPEGYVKGMPTALIVEDAPMDDASEIQQVEMRDDTTKVWIEKRDSPDSYETESRASYTHSQVEAAELVLYPAKRIYTEATDAYPKGYYLQKTSQDPVRFATTDSRASQKEEMTARWVTGLNPIYLEGVPEGLYLLEETVTPEGFVTGKPMEVEILPDSQVQTFTMNNDHTKVEVEKYEEVSGEKRQVAGAELTLYEAVTDGDGTVQYENGMPCYDPEKKVTSWLSGRRGQYAGFMAAFEEMYRDYGIQGRTVSWNQNGKEHTAHCISDTQERQSESGAFPTAAQVIFAADSGIQIRIGIYEEKENRQGRDFSFEYQFDYQRLPQVNEYCASYETVDGVRRLNYLPAGTSYVLVETGVPDGYRKGEDLVITIENRQEVQRYLLANEGRSLLISKTEEGKQSELPGARLALYEAGADGQLSCDGELLLEAWISGSDGIYTEADEINGRIPAGYQAGDLKPHEIRCLRDGIYYLVEWESPEGYEVFEPLRFVYDGADAVRLIRAENRREEPELPPDPTEPETPTEPEESEPETTEPDPTEPETPTEPEASEPETTEPEPTEPETPTEPEESEPETTEPKPTEPERPTEPGERETEPRDPEKPEQPEETSPVPETEPAVNPGKVVAQYSGRFHGDGGNDPGTFGNIRIPQTGDPGILPLLFVFLSSLIVAVILWFLRRRKQNAASLHLWAGIFLGIALAVSGATETFASTPTVTAALDGGITVRFPSFTEDMQNPALPPEAFVWEGEEYQLASSRLVASMTEEKSQPVSQTIVYSDVEQADHVPDQMMISVTNEDTGQVRKEQMPAVEVTFGEGRWSRDFLFPITVERYDAGVYELGGELITCGESQPFAGCEEELLKLIGVSPEYYQIESTWWVGEAEPDKRGQVCRAAMASGRKYVADCQVTYGGTVTFPAVPGLAYEAEYRKPQEAEIPEIVIQSSDQESGTETLEHPASDPGPLGWVVTVTTLTVGLLALILFLILVLWLVKKRQRKNEDRS